MFKTKWQLWWEHLYELLVLYKEMSEREVIILLNDKEDEKEGDDIKDEFKEVYDGGWGWYVVAG